VTVRDEKTTAPGSRAPAGAPGPRPAVGTIEGPVFTRKNYVLFAIALAVITLGFVVLGTGDITLAPILLVLGYLVLAPLAILKR